MTLLRNYLVMAVFRGVATVLAVLVAITCAIEFVGQLNDVGTGDYNLQAAVTYVVLRVPRTIFTTLPIAALIGALLSLGNLAVHRELIVMRASGVSSWQLLSAVGLAGFALAVLMVLLGESLAPSLGAYASELRTRTMHDDIALAKGQADLASRRRPDRELAAASRRSRLRWRRADVRHRPTSRRSTRSPEPIRRISTPRIVGS